MNTTFKILTIGLFIISCTPHNKEADISNIDLNLKINRFDRELFETGDEASVQQLSQKYPAFFDIFLKNIIGINQEPGTSAGYYLKSFTSDSYILEVSETAEKQFPDLSGLEEQFTKAFKFYKIYFPEKPVPKLVSFITGFHYAIVVDDSLLGFGLDMYLGSECSYYPRLGIPKYKFQRMTADFIVADCMTGWISTEYEENNRKNDLLSHMVYQGKLLYALDLLLPDEDDHIKAGYSIEQIEWCRENEPEVWAHFIERELLFKQDNSIFTKYMAEGPFTPGFPEGSPGQVGKWVGWQIVRKYMENNPSVSLEQLFSEKTDANLVLNESLYKPKR